jgi:hypothetical protein
MGLESNWEKQKIRMYSSLELISVTEKKTALKGSKKCLGGEVRNGLAKNICVRI